MPYDVYMYIGLHMILYNLHIMQYKEKHTQNEEK